MNKSESKYFNTAVRMDNALISLLKKKPLEYITVSELCTEAGVNRSTFYLHYETIEDILEETARYLIEEFLSYFSSDEMRFFPDPRMCEAEELNFVCDKYLIPYLTYIRKNREVFTTVVSNQKLLGFDEVYRKLFEHIFNPILDRFRYPEKDRKYVMMYYLNGINAINTEWLRGGCREAETEISRIIRECIFGLHGTLQNFI